MSGPDGDPAIASRRSRPDRWDLAFILIGVGAVAAWLALGRSLTFYHDDWVFFDQRLDWSADAFLRPHNEHWVTVPAIVWKSLMATVGLTSYLPYLALNAIAHVGVAAAVYWGTRVLAGPVAGLVVGSLMLSVPVGGELHFHAIGGAIVLATAFGAWALVLAIAGTPSRPRLVALLLLLAVASGGPGLFFVGAVATLLIFTPGRRRELWTIAPATVAYAIWFLVYGRSETSVAFPFALNELQALRQWLQDGMSFAVGSATGLGREIGLVLLVLLFAATLWQQLGRGPYLAAALAALAGLAFQYVIVGLVRVDVAGSPANAPRYAYTGAVFVLLALSVWYGPRPRKLPINSLPLLVAAALVVFLNLQGIRWWADSWYTPRSQETRAAIDVALEHGGTPLLPGDRRPLHPTDPFLRSMPSADRMREIIRVLGGNPIDDTWQPGTYPSPPDVHARIEAEMLGLAAPTPMP